MIENQIRYFRQKRGLTLAQLAERTGTTPQSISRLETGVMKLSMDWVEKIGAALDVAPQQLLGGHESQSVPLIGLIDTGPDILPLKNQTVGIGDEIGEPVALQVESAVGPFQTGDLLIFDRSESMPLDAFVGKLCLVALGGSALRMGKLIHIHHNNPEGGYLLIPVDDNAPTVRLSEVEWIAPLRLQCRPFNI